MLRDTIYHETLATSDSCHILMKHRSAFHMAPIYASLLHNKSFTSLKPNPRELKIQLTIPTTPKPTSTALSPLSKSPRQHQIQIQMRKKNTHSNESIPPQTFHAKVLITSSRILFLTNIRYHKSNPTPKFLLPSHPILHIHTYIHDTIPSSKPIGTCIRTYIHTYGQNRNRGPWGGGGNS